MAIEKKQQERFNVYRKKRELIKHYTPEILK